MNSQQNDPEGTYSKLKGQAGEAKHLSNVVSHVFDSLKQRSVRVYGLISLMMKKFIEVDDILDADTTTHIPDYQRLQRLHSKQLHSMHLHF